MLNKMLRDQGYKPVNEFPLENERFFSDESGDHYETESDILKSRDTARDLTPRDKIIAVMSCIFCDILAVVFAVCMGGLAWILPLLGVYITIGGLMSMKNGKMKVHSYTHTYKPHNRVHTRSNIPTGRDHEFILAKPFSFGKKDKKNDHDLT